MLKWKKHRFTSIADTIEDTYNLLSGASGKNRVVKFIAGPQTASLYLRVYKDADQIVDIESNKLTSAAPLLPMDLPLAVGQNCHVGFLNSTGGTKTNQDFIIGYEEAE